MIFLLKVLAFSFIITGFIAMVSNLYLGRSELVSLYKSLQDNVNIKKDYHNMKEVLALYSVHCYYYYYTAHII